MQDLLLLLGTVILFATGFLAPFVMTLAYVWVDLFTPQDISASLLVGQPIALVFGAAAVAIYLLRDRRDPPGFNVIILLEILICIWASMTNFWAVAPVIATWRWSVAIKVCIFATFLPYVIRTRVQIEALILVYILSIAGHIIPWGVKTFITGGGYQQSLGLLGVNSALLAESSSVSAIAVAIVPLILVMMKHSILLPKSRVVKFGWIALIVVSMVAAIGTFARTALIAFGVGGIAMWLRSRRKIVFLLISVVLIGIMYSVTSDRWTARISTVADYENENSAFIRILVWEWTWNFVQSHPFGGGFWAYVVNKIELPAANGGPPIIQFSRAYHNIYFGVLGDLGYPGLVLYLALVVMSLGALQKARKLTMKLVEHAWCADMAQAVQISMLTMLAAGMFVEIGWSPIVWYLFSFAVCLRQYALRVTTPETVARVPIPLLPIPEPLGVRGLPIAMGRNLGGR